MTELKWLKLSGLMQQCVYNRENPKCPFLDYRKMDRIQQYQSLNKISDSDADNLLGACSSCRIQHKEVKNKDLVIRNAEHFKVVG